MKIKFKIIFWLLTILAVAAPCPGKDSSCRYVDAKGVTHFYTPRATPGYTIYVKMPDGREKRFTPKSGSYEGIIAKAGKRFGVDTALIKAVIRVESNFKPGAVSKKGARGLMQIMPENDAALNISNPFDPTQNIMGGTYHLKQLLTRYNKNTALALAAYNAGAGAVDKYRSIPPYPETRDYVRRVMAFYNTHGRTTDLTYQYPDSTHNEK